jgi:hypothetical protein
VPECEPSGPISIAIGGMENRIAPAPAFGADESEAVSKGNRSVEVLVEHRDAVNTRW